MSISPMLLGIRNIAITTQHKSLGQKKGVKKVHKSKEKNNNNTIFYVAYLVAYIKGQLISKCLFVVFNFFQKTNENK